MSEERRKYRLLAKEVLMQSVKESTQRRDNQDRREAIAWFKERGSGPFGFRWCLGVSGMNGKAIVRYLQTKGVL